MNTTVSEYHAVVSEFDAVVSEYHAVVSEFEAVVSEYHAVVSEFDAVVCEYNAIVSEYDAVVCEYDAIVSEYDAVVCEYDAMVSEYDEVVPDYEDKSFWVQRLVSESGIQFLNPTSSFWSVVPEYSEVSESDFSLLNKGLHKKGILRNSNNAHNLMHP